jgi:SPP1 family predicted phage head-tail adaptor
MLQEAIDTPDGAGGVAREWRDVAEVSAAIAALRGGEALRFRQLQSSVTHRIYLRYRDGVTPQMRIVKGTKVYNILSVADRDGSGVFLEILAES